MALFDRFKKKQTKQPAKKADALQDSKKYTDNVAATPRVAQQKSAKKVADKKASKKSEEKKEVSIVDTKAGSYARLLIKPHVSEKAAVLADRGIYVFDVPVSANKVEIGKAVEAIYKVSVAKVRTQRGIGKVMRRGRIKGRRNAWKKALVELKKGQTITLVEGV
jgi:large subunit ribosomal protein L23